MTMKMTRRTAIQAMLASTAAATVMHAIPAWAQQKGGTLTVGLTYEIDTMNVYSTGFLGDAQAAVAILGHAPRGDPPTWRVPPPLRRAHAMLVSRLHRRHLLVRWWPAHRRRRLPSR